MFRDNRKARIIYTLFLVIVAVCIVHFAGGLNSKKQQGTSKGLSTEKVDGKCTVMVECKTILNNMDKLDLDLRKLVPSKGVILKKTTVGLQKNDTAFSVLSRTLKKNKINFETSGSGENVYVKGISDFYEFSCGQESGWLYAVNGKQPKVSAGAYNIKNGDEIVWHYTCALGDFK